MFPWMLILDFPPPDTAELAEVFSGWLLPIYTTEVFLSTFKYYLS